MIDSIIDWLNNNLDNNVIFQNVTDTLLKVNDKTLIVTEDNLNTLTIFLNECNNDKINKLFLDIVKLVKDDLRFIINESDKYINILLPNNVDINVKIIITDKITFEFYDKTNVLYPLDKVLETLISKTTNKKQFKLNRIFHIIDCFDNIFVDYIPHDKVNDFINEEILFLYNEFDISLYDYSQWTSKHVITTENIDITGEIEENLNSIELKLKKNNLETVHMRYMSPIISYFIKTTDCLAVELNLKLFKILQNICEILLKTFELASLSFVCGFANNEITDLNYDCLNVISFFQKNFR